MKLPIQAMPVMRGSSSQLYKDIGIIPLGDCTCRIEEDENGTKKCFNDWRDDDCDPVCLAEYKNGRLSSCNCDCK